MEEHNQDMKTICKKHGVEEKQWRKIKKT